MPDQKWKPEVVAAARDRIADNIDCGKTISCERHRTANEPHWCACSDMATAAMDASPLGNALDLLQQVGSLSDMVGPAGELDKRTFIVKALNRAAAAAAFVARVREG